MRRRLTWLLGAIGLAGLVAYLRRRRGPRPEDLPEAQADELRRTLEETRATAEQLDRPPTSAAEPEPEALEARREDVHDRARAALDEMAPPSPD